MDDLTPTFLEAVEVVLLRVKAIGQLEAQRTKLRQAANVALFDAGREADMTMPINARRQAEWLSERVVDAYIAAYNECWLPPKGAA